MSDTILLLVCWSFVQLCMCSVGTTKEDPTRRENRRRGGQEGGEKRQRPEDEKSRVPILTFPRVVVVRSQPYNLGLHMPIVMQRGLPDGSLSARVY